MLSDIRHTWPPTHATDRCIQTGTKTSRSTILSLVDLHSHAWWTGVRVTCESDQPIRVKLLTKDGPAFSFDHVWSQEHTEWHPLPWPIPAAMAKAMGLFLQIDVTGPVVITGCYHDIPQLDIHDRYLFVKGRSVLHHWNGRQRTWGDRQRGEPPMWRTIHRIVPPMSVILEGVEDDVFCIHDWNEELPESKM